MKRFDVILVIVALAVATFISNTRAQRPPVPGKTLQAERLEIVDANGNAKILLTTDADGRGVIQIGDQFGNPIVIITSESRASVQPLGAGTHGILSIRSALWLPDGAAELQALETIGGVNKWIYGR